MTTLTCVLMPLLLGLLSLRLGQDDNWDLKNYHFYNPFAYLNGKIGFDLAPAQWQSYFNPTLDLLYYGLSTSLPAPVAGFLMGVLHGLNFLLVLSIARLVLPSPSPSARFGAPLLVSIAAMISPGFLAQVGNSMGDNMTSLFVLSSLCLLLHFCGPSGEGDAVRMPNLAVLGAGLIMGLGCGLKLTNSIYALALCIAVAMISGGVLTRLRMMTIFGIGVLMGIAITGGHWFILMYQTFGNPLFPQFNNHFLAPMASPIGIGDTNWLPKNWSERLLWPFIFAADPRRVSELQLRLWLWPILYVGMLALAANTIARGGRRHDGDGTAPYLVQRQRVVLCFFAVSYLAWIALFSIYRYLVPLELLAPLVICLLAARLLPKRMAALIAATIIVVGALAGVPRVSWGHASWARQAITVTVPKFADPRESMVFTVHGDPPLGWLVTQFPATLAFAAVGSGFPESQAFVAKLDQMAARRKGPLFAMMQADRADPMVPRTAAELDTARAQDRAVVERATELLARYKLALDPNACTAYPAMVGKSRWNYQLCSVKVIGK